MTKPTSQDSISCLPSLTRTDTSRKTFSYCIVNYLHPESTSSLLIQVHKTPDFPVIVQSLYLSNFCNKRTWLKLVGAAEKIRHSAKIAQLQIFHPCYVHKKFYLSILYRSIDLLQNYPPNPLLTIWSSSSNTNQKLFALSSQLTRTSESCLSLLGTSSNRFLDLRWLPPEAFQFNSHLVWFGNPTVCRHRPSFINSAPSPFIIIRRHLPST